MKKIYSILLIFSTLTALSACKKNDISNEDRYFDPSLPSGEMIFSQLPIDITKAGYILPLGHVNPPGHTRPSDHIYFVFVSPGAIIYAPASGKVLDEYAFDEGNGLHDNRITIGVTNTASYYFMHLILDKDIHIGDKISAGQRLGKLPEAYAVVFDMGTMVKTINQPFIDKKLYGLLSLHCDSPIKHFPKDIREALYAKVRRLGPDKDGKICYDVPGTLSGNWIAEKAPRDLMGTPNFESYFVSFVYGNYDPSKMVISIGNDSFYTPVTGSGAFNQDILNKVFYVQENAPKFEDVTPADGKVAYKLYNTGEFGGTKVQREGLLIVQMLNTDKIKIEYFNDTTSNSRDFTGNAKIYVR